MGYQSSNSSRTSSYSNADSSSRKVAAAVDEDGAVRERALFDNDEVENEGKDELDEAESAERAREEKCRTGL